MRKTWAWCWFLGAMLGAGCGAVPDVVRDACAHQAEDFRLMERDLVPALPETAAIWGPRIQAFRVRAEALAAWAAGEAYDPANPKETP